MADVAALAADLIARAEGRARFVVAIAGPPGAGKSTLCDALLAALERQAPGAAVLVPMDGYHYDNAVLEAMGLLARKGAPATFDVGGLAADLGRIAAGEDSVAVPVFDRRLDLARAGARLVRREHRIVVVEGNYLLLDDEPWRGLAGRFDRTVFLDVPEERLRQRLVARWLEHGLDAEAARARAESNDLPNANLVLTGSVPADVVWPAG
jgi:pantothenate kinase